MNFNHKNLLELFDSSQKTFVIPVYQRAYSWEEKEWKTFIEDLIEQVESKNNYFFGNILLETIKKGIQYEVIDGQQRLTTLTIFMRSLFDVLRERKKSDDVAVNIEEKEKIFLKDGGNKKLRPVTYDMACYDALIMDGKANFETGSASQKRIKNAKTFFTRELQKKSTVFLLEMLDKIESTEITSIELQGKKDAALMFELQNNRGKDLTNMERLKSYLMYQMYVYSKPEETESNIEYVSNIFKELYHIISDIKQLTEDSLLIYHCNAYIKGYDYRTLDDIKEIFKKSSDKVVWIMQFIEELHTSFANMKKMEHSKDRYLMRLRGMSMPVFVYPFLIKGYKYIDDDLRLSKLFHLMEILVFRYSLVNSRAYINSRLNDLLINFNGNIENLIAALKNKLNSDWYWGDAKIRNILDEWMYENDMLHYILWQYEASIQNKGYVVGSMQLKNEQIEHVSPKVPPGEHIASGYEVDSKTQDYTEEFARDYLNCLGNLMLISGSHNASIGNRPFKEKLKSYMKNPLLNQQGEIKSFISGSERQPRWDTIAIDKRHKAILDFAINNWNFDSV